MSYEELVAYMNLLIDYLKNFFDFQINFVFFSYIFDYSRIDEKKIKTMCKSLDSQKIKYIFYDINTLSYFDNAKKKINNIENSINKFRVSEEVEDVQVAQYPLNIFQKDKIKNILESIYIGKKISYRLFNIGFLSITDLKNKALFCITKFNGKKGSEIYIFYFNNENLEIKLLKDDGSTSNDESIFNTMIFKNMVDFYKIILE